MLTNQGAAHPLVAGFNPSAPVQRRDTMPLLARRDTQELVSGKQLQAWGVPFGLARMLEQEQENIARRVFLLDNSGSTGAGDGHLVKDEDGRITSTPCTRWEEIAHMAVEQAKWNLCLGVPAEFVMLNPLGASDVDGVGYVVCDPALGAHEGQVQHLEAWLRKNGPKGCTPLAQRLGEIQARIQAQRQELSTACQRVCVVIATDGMPTSPLSGQTTQQDKRTLVQALRSLAALDVHIVLRLCTDDDEVVEFYGNLDSEVEMSLEVLDDLESEAKELQQNGNGWLTYTPLMHRIREGGCFNKLMDLLDERPLTPPEVYLFVQMLVQRDDADSLPRPAALFCDEVERRLKENRDKVFNPLTNRQEPPIQMRALRRAMGLSVVQRVQKCVTACTASCAVM